MVGRSADREFRQPLRDGCPMTSGQTWGCDRPERLSELCTRLGIRLEDVAARNVAKLADRAARGVLHGEGDHR